MAKLHYLKGDATLPRASGIKVIAHICNDIGGWGRGFVVAISKRWQIPEESYRAWHRDRAQNDFALGAIQIVQGSSYIYIANMVAQHGIGPSAEGPPIRYDALAECLTKLAPATQEMGGSIHMPRIGTGLAGGKWEQIEPIIQQKLIAAGIDVYVYDFE